MGSTLMGALKAHGLTGLLTLIGLKGGAVGAFVGNKAGAAIGGIKAAGIKQTGDLVKEAMLNPELARLLLVKLTPQNQGTVTSAVVGQLGRDCRCSGGTYRCGDPAPGAAAVFCASEHARISRRRGGYSGATA